MDTYQSLTELPADTAGYCCLHGLNTGCNHMHHNWKCFIHSHLRSTFHVAMPITCPQGEMAGETAGSKVMGSIQPGKGLSLSTYLSSSLPPQRFLYRS